MILLNLVCAAVLTAGIMKMGQSGYHVETWGDILKGRSWTGTSEYEQQAAEAVYGAVAAAAQSSRLEQNGEYDPDRIIRIRDYLEDRTVYDMMPEEQKKEGICYRLGGPVSVEPERGECTAGRASGTVQPAFLREHTGICQCM